MRKCQIACKHAYEDVVGTRSDQRDINQETVPGAASAKQDAESIASEDEHTNSDELAVETESDAETYRPTFEILSANHRRRRNSNVRAVAGWRWRKF